MFQFSSIIFCREPAFLTAIAGANDLFISVPLGGGLGYFSFFPIVFISIEPFSHPLCTPGIEIPALVSSYSKDTRVQIHSEREWQRVKAPSLSE